MVNYGNGKIYKIESYQGDLIYIGSTTKEYLSQRMDTHRSDYKRWKNGKCNLTTSFKIFDEYGLENCTIVLLEIVACNSKDELLAREAFYIRNLECVNKIIPGRTQKEYLDDHKEAKKDYDKLRNENNQQAKNEQNKFYYEKNKEVIKARMKLYNAANKEVIKAKMKVYHEANKETVKVRNDANKEAIKARMQFYYQANKEALDERRRLRRAALKQIET